MGKKFPRASAKVHVNPFGHVLNLLYCGLLTVFLCLRISVTRNVIHGLHGNKYSNKHSTEKEDGVVLYTDWAGCTNGSSNKVHNSL